MISINFATRNYRLRERLHVGLQTAGLLLALTGAGMIWWSSALRADAAALSGKIRELEAVEAEYRPLLAEREQIIKDLSAVSGLLETRRLSWTGILTDIESIFPTGVALQKFEYNRKDRLIALDGVAISPEALSRLMLALEKNSAFKDPYLKHQSIEKGKITFNVVAVYQEHTDAGPVQGK